jgi:hypothetical protein
MVKVSTGASTAGAAEGGSGGVAGVAGATTGGLVTGAFGAAGFAGTMHVPLTHVSPGPHSGAHGALVCALAGRAVVRAAVAKISKISASV